MTLPLPNIRRPRSLLLFIALLFVLPLVVAWTLFASGWRPTASRNHGHLYAPAQDFRGVMARGTNGRPVVWENRNREWHLLLLAPAECDKRCASMLDTVHRVWLGLGRHAAHVQVHFVGRPDAASRAVLARVQAFDVIALSDGVLPGVAPDAVGLPVYLVDPHGYLVMRFDPGFEPGGLRRDLVRLLR